MVKRLVISAVLALLPVVLCAQPGKSDLARCVNKLHALLNDHRENVGQPEFRNESSLAEAALSQASYLVKAKDLTHEQKPSKKRTPEERVKSGGGEFTTVTELLCEIGSDEKKFTRREILAHLPAIIDKWKEREPEMFSSRYDYAGIAFTYDSKRDVVFCVLLLAKK